jgi:predicted O-methyltransferase YrrM
MFYIIFFKFFYKKFLYGHLQIKKYIILIIKMSDYFPLNADAVTISNVDWLIRTLKLTTAVETGTYKGKTTKWLANRMKKVYTIENNLDFFNCAKENFKNIDNIEIILGNSGNKIEEIIKQIPLEENTLFYLDAHWYDYWPILDELTTIGKNKQLNNLIIIDDFKVPGCCNYLNYDKYENNENSLEYINNVLNEYFKDYNYFFNKLSFPFISTQLGKQTGQLYLFHKNFSSYFLENLICENNFYYCSLFLAQ